MKFASIWLIFRLAFLIDTISRNDNWIHTLGSGFAPVTGEWRSNAVRTSWMC